MAAFVHVHVMHCGEVRVDRALAFQEKTWHPLPTTGLFRPAQYKLWLPVSCYLIEHPKGPVVVDTGLRERVRTPPGLAAVILSHRDFDHIHGATLLSGAAKFLISDPERKAANAFERKQLAHINLETFSLESIPFGPHQLGKDLYGDGLIYLVYTPGHTAGHVSVLARVRDGWLLLAGDAGYAARSWQEPVLPGITSSKEQALASLQWIRAFSQRTDCVATIANHDPDVQPRSF